MYWLAMTANAVTGTAADLTQAEITVLAGPGSGYDQLARSVQKSMQGQELANSIQMVNRLGTGGTIALANFINSNSSATNLMATGIGMVGSIITSHSPVRMERTKPFLMAGHENSK